MEVAILRTIDEQGRISLPADFRRALDLGPGDTLDVQLLHGEILIRKHQPGCAICGGRGKQVVPVRDKVVCRECAAEVAASA
ncbi:MAG: AbrB/MazE/SpoVT family DNA-binding domain-containing protein [Clostridia bacterium]|nr:AbrB/MazE/SpoVT family DNA-binding domain-containing protein [Clostridia bacterium]